MLWEQNWFSVAHCLFHLQAVWRSFYSERKKISAKNEPLWKIGQHRFTSKAKRKAGIQKCKMAHGLENWCQCSEFQSASKPGPSLEDVLHHGGYIGQLWECCGCLPAGPSPLCPGLCKDPNQGRAPWLVKRNILCFPEQSCAGWAISPAPSWWEMTRCEREGKCFVIVGESCLVLVRVGTQAQRPQFPGNSRETKKEQS